MACFEHRHEAEAFERALETRLAKFGLKLAAMQRMREWTKTHRHLKLRRLMKTLQAKLRGTWNYYGLIGNYRRMQLLYEGTCRALHKWLNRRSQRKSLTWSGVNRLLRRFQVPRPRIVEQRGVRMPCQLELSFCQRLARLRGC